jgi:uncharacterized protein (TIGR02246 family)
MAEMTRPADVPQAFQSAWNNHDMAALGTLFKADATFVNCFATYTRGVEGIVALHRGIHETIFRDSTLENELISVDQIAGGVAVVHFWSRLTTGAAHPRGAAPGRYAHPGGGHRARWRLADSGRGERHTDRPKNRPCRLEKLSARSFESAIS